MTMKRTTRLVPWAIIAAVGIAGTILILVKEPRVPTDEHGHGAHEEHEDHGVRHVDMPDDVMKAAGIELKTAGIATLTVGAIFPGEVAYDQDRIAHVSPRIRGTVRESRAHLGDRVRAGQVLAVFDAPELGDIRRRYDAARSRSELARSAMIREERLWKRKISAERNFLEAKQAYEESLIDLRGARSEFLALGLTESDFSGPSPAAYPLRSPIAGVVAEKHAVVGEVVEPARDNAEQASFVIADLSTVWIEMAIPAASLRHAKIGQTVVAVSKDLGESITGRIAHVGTALDERTRSVEAHAEVVNPGKRWRPGLQVTVLLAENSVEVPVAIRPTALQTIDDRTMVFVRKGDAFEARPVVVGRKSGDWVEIVSGLRAGEKYAAGNSFILKADIGKGEAGHDH